MQDDTGGAGGSADALGIERTPPAEGVPPPAGGEAPPAGGEAPPAVGGETPPAGGDSPFLESFPEDQRGFVEKKQWQSNADMLKSYRDAEAALSVPADRVLKLPGPDDPAEAWDPIWQKLGRPADAEGYQFDGVEIPEGTTDMRPEFAKWSLAEGLTDKQAAGVAKAYTDFTVGIIEDFEKGRVAQMEADGKQLHDEWADKFDEKKGDVLRACRKFGYDGEHLDKLDASLGHYATMVQLQAVGELLREHQVGDLDEDTRVQFGITPRQAAEEIAELKKDKGFFTKLQAGDTEAKKRWENLHAIAGEYLETQHRSTGAITELAGT